VLDFGSAVIFDGFSGQKGKFVYAGYRETQKKGILGSKREE